MRFLDEYSEYSINRKFVSDVIKCNTAFPDQVFTGRMRQFLFISFDLVLTRQFFTHTKSFIQAIGESAFLFSVIDPDPNTYFYKHFSKYSVIDFSITDTEEDYMAALDADPGDSPADALMHNTNSVLMHSSSSNWAIYAERELGIGVCSFTDKSIRDVFLNEFDVDFLQDIDGAIKLMGLAFKNRKVPIDIENVFRNCYSV